VHCWWGGVVTVLSSAQAGLPSYEGVINTISEAWDTLARAVPNASIYGSVGNHDAFPGDKFPYPYDGFKSMSDIWGPHGLTPVR